MGQLFRRCFGVLAFALSAMTLSTARGTTESDLGEMSLEDLMNVEVTSVSKSKQRIAEAPAAVTVITQEDIQHSGLRQIPEILRLAPGLFVQHSNQLTHWSVASRGFADTFSNKLLVIQDGRTVYTPFFSGVYWDSIDYPIADLDRIEVIRGPGATLWGSNAVNGVINITSKSARDTQGWLVDSRVGTHESDLAIRYGGQLDDNTYYRIFAKGRAFDDLGGSMPLTGQIESQWQDFRGGIRIDRHLNDQDTLTVQAEGFGADISSQGFIPGLTPNYDGDRRAGAHVLARYTHAESPTSSYSVQMYYDHFEQQDSIISGKTETFDVNFEHHFEPAPRHSFVYGLSARLQLDRVTSPTTPEPNADPADQKLYILGAFIQDTITLVPDRLQFIPGAKLEYNSLVGVELQPSVRLVWTPSDKTTVWGSVARAMRTPSIYEGNIKMISFMDMPPMGMSEFVTRGNPDLKSEELIAYEIGLRHRFNKALSVDATAFYNKYDHLSAQRALPPEFVTTPPFPRTRFVSQFENAQHGETYGVELAANWQVTNKWRLSGSYSVLQMVIEDDMPDVTAIGVETGSPQTMFQLHSYYDITRTLSFNTSFYYASEITYPASPFGPGMETDAVARLDANLTWRPKDGLDLSVGVQNALDPWHNETLLTSGGAGEVGMNFYGQLTWRF